MLKHWPSPDLYKTWLLQDSCIEVSTEDTDTPTKFSGHSYNLNSQGIYDITSSSNEKLSEWHNMQQLDSIFTL
jgi:hypothetical protein